jgi:hypothetical protein
VEVCVVPSDHSPPPRLRTQYITITVTNSRNAGAITDTESLFTPFQGVQSEHSKPLAPNGDVAVVVAVTVAGI